MKTKIYFTYGGSENWVDEDYREWIIDQLKKYGFKISKEQGTDSECLIMDTDIPELQENMPIIIDGTNYIIKHKWYDLDDKSMCYSIDII